METLPSFPIALASTRSSPEAAMCALCPARASIFCPADSANLCASCDREVHAANPIVHRHTRAVLCHRCSAPTALHLCGLPNTAALPPCLCGSCLLEPQVMWPLSSTATGRISRESSSNGPAPWSTAVTTNALNLSSIDPFESFPVLPAVPSLAAAAPTFHALSHAVSSHDFAALGNITEASGALPATAAAAAASREEDSPLSTLTCDSGTTLPMLMGSRQATEHQLEGCRTAAQGCLQPARLHRTLSLFPESPVDLSRPVDLQGDASEAPALPSRAPTESGSGCGWGGWSDNKRRRTTRGIDAGAQGRSRCDALTTHHQTAVGQKRSAAAAGAAASDADLHGQARVNVASATKEIPALGDTASARLQRVLLTWQSRLGLEVSSVRSLAFHLLQRVLRRLRPADVAGDSLRVLLAACLWVAAKAEENQKKVPKAKAVAEVTKIPVGKLVACEVEVLKLLDWEPLKGWLNQQ